MAMRYFIKLIFLKTGIWRNFCHKISMKMSLLSAVKQSFSWAFGTIFLATWYTFNCIITINNGAAWSIEF